MAQQEELVHVVQELKGKKHPAQLYGGFLTCLPFFLARLEDESSKTGFDSVSNRPGWPIGGLKAHRLG